MDKTISGKNGVNSKYGKNLIGTFYNPSEVIIDVNFLKTLPERNEVRLCRNYKACINQRC